MGFRRTGSYDRFKSARSSLDSRHAPWRIISFPITVRKLGQVQEPRILTGFVASGTFSRKSFRDPCAAFLNRKFNVCNESRDLAVTTIVIETIHWNYERDRFEFLFKVTRSLVSLPATYVDNHRNGQLTVLEINLPFRSSKIPM